MTKKANTLNFTSKIQALGLKATGKKQFLSALFRLILPIRMLIREQVWDCQFPKLM